MKLSINVMWLFGKLNTVIIFITVANVTSKDFRVSTNWKVIEALAENHPYIVGLLNKTKDYVCTGTIIDHRTVLTSGNCIKAKPSYIAVGASVISRDIGTKNLFQIAAVALHTDYVCELKEFEPNVTQIHSNIGIVFSLQPDLEYYIERAAFGSFYASELKDQKLTVIGYGKINNSNAVVLQQQNYLQMPCANPKWYYCVCGIEYTTHMNNFRNPFGQGAPVIFNSEVVGVTAYPCRALTLPAVNFHYNIFTVVAPYMRWIRNNQNATGIIQMRARNNANYPRKILCVKYIYTLGAIEIVTCLITIILCTKIKPPVFLRFTHDALLSLAPVLVKNISQISKMKPLKKVGIIGVPFDKGQKKYGVSIAPAALRHAGLVEKLKEIDELDVKDYGDINTATCEMAETVKVDNMSHLQLVSACNRKLSERVSQVLRDGRVAVTIGGDHSIGVGTVDGHYNVNEDMILIWVDAHADINTNKTSDSGSVHGMPVALLVKELADYWPYLPTMDWQIPKFSIKNLGYVGLRSVDQYEMLAISKYEVPAFAMEDIDEHGIKNSIEHILRVLDPDKVKPIHVSFDIDSLDALEAPSTGTPVRGGLTLREAINLMEIIHSTGRLRAIDLVEINPALGNEADRKRTIEAGLCVLKAGLGFSRRGTAPRGVLDLPVQTHHHNNNI